MSSFHVGCNMGNFLVAGALSWTDLVVTGLLLLDSLFPDLNINLNSVKTGVPKIWPVAWIQPAELDCLALDTGIPSLPWHMGSSTHSTHSH